MCTSVQLQEESRGERSSSDYSRPGSQNCRTRAHLPHLSWNHTTSVGSQEIKLLYRASIKGCKATPSFLFPKWSFVSEEFIAGEVRAPFGAQAHSQACLELPPAAQLCGVSTAYCCLRWDSRHLLSTPTSQFAVAGVIKTGFC